MRQMLETTANAKLNLALRVTGRRMDGYHFLDSFISFCKFGDTVKISLSSTSDQVTMTGPFAPAITGPNIVEVARDQFRDITGWKQALHIHIIKHIPVSGGLGGGSADAAAVLRLLNQLWPGPPLSHWRRCRGLSPKQSIEGPLYRRRDSYRQAHSQYSCALGKSKS